MRHFRSTLVSPARSTSAVLTFTLACIVMLVAGPAIPATIAAPVASEAQILYNLNLPNGQTAVVFKNGVAAVFSKDHKKVEFRSFPATQQYDEMTPNAGLPDKAHLLADLAMGPKTPFADGRVNVVFRNGVTGTSDVVSAAQIPNYTNDQATNALLESLGVDRSERLFRQFDRGTLSSMHAKTEEALGYSILDFSNAYRLHITATSVRHAVAALLASPSVAYAWPDWHVASTNTSSLAVPSAETQAATKMNVGPGATGNLISSSSVPSNFGLASSAQSLLNAPSVDAAAAFDEIDKQYHQLPGQGEIITNVSLGDLDDSSVVNNFSDRCGFWATVFGPTTQIIGGQRYINWPSMPLIPAYTADASGNLSGSAEVCGVDPFLGEVGLDFSMMAPLPHNVQRPGELGSGLTDLLGIAPGASYRLVVPGSFSPTITDIDGAFLGAGAQTPAPNIITASLGFGVDQFGFSGRYLEDDPLTEAIVAALVNKNIVVNVSAGDGTRTFTNAAIGPSGGSAPTNAIPPGGSPSDLNDIAFSGAPSQDFDSGSLDVGGTTLDDLFSAPPQDPAFADLTSQHAYAETRWNGFTLFSSGYGSRVNVSAPSDNVLGLSHPFGGAFDSVNVNLTGGTSASAPETAAAAAVALQVARLSGHPFPDPVHVRRFLQQTGTDVPGVSQSDVDNHIGPQINVRRVVETLLRYAGTPVSPSVPRVAVEQRRNFALFDAGFLSATDPSNINLQGPISSVDNTPTDRNAKAWITIAPDWEGLPPDAQFQLSLAANSAKVLASTPWARLLPEQILAAAGLPLASTTSRTVQLTYGASENGVTLAQSTFSLTFGPADTTTRAVLAPIVPPVVSGSTIPVKYDLTNARNVSNPTLIVSEPGRVDPATGFLFHPAYTAPLTALSGTVQVPVSALQGGGVYGIGIHFGSVGSSPLYSDFAFTRVAPTSTNRPAAPLLSAKGSTPGHFLEIPYGGSFQVSWDVSNVPGATNAVLEISAPGPTDFANLNPFNNPNGSEQDQNGVDTGSPYFVPLNGRKGTTTLDGKAVGLVPTMNHVVRVLPLRSGVPGGEAGDVSTVTMDGVFAADGGFVNNGFGVNGSGHDGFLTSGQQTASGQIVTSLETFDQTSNAITKTVASESNHLFFTNGWGIFGGDVGLYGDFDLTTSLSPFNLLNPVASGTVGSAWTPPSPSTLSIDEAAANQANDNGAFLAFDTTAPFKSASRLFTSNITSNTFGPLYDLSGPVSSFGLPVYFGIGQNTTTNRAVLGAGDFFNFCGPPTIVTADLGTGSLDSFTGVGSGVPFGMGVDSVTNKAAVPTACDNSVGIYDLATKTGTATQVPGSSLLYTAIDQSRGLILATETVPGDFGTNNNGMSSVVVLDESGHVLKNIERFFLWDTFLSIAANNLQLNAGQRSGYTFGPFQQQLEPFNY